MIGGERGDLVLGGFIPGGIWSYPAKTGGIYSGGGFVPGGFDPTLVLGTKEKSTDYRRIYRLQTLIFIVMFRLHLKISLFFKWIISMVDEQEYHIKRQGLE